MRPRHLGAAYHIERAVAFRQGLHEYPCACTRCHGGRICNSALIARHHRMYGRDPYLPHPVMTVDRRNLRGPVDMPEAGEEAYARRRSDEDEPGFVWPQRTQVQVEDMVRDAYARADDIHEAVHGQPDSPRENLWADDEADINIEAADMEELLQESTQPLYEGCGINRLQASIVMMNMINLYGVPQTFLDELLCFLSADLLPQANSLPRNAYEMKRMIMKMGLEHEAIHCCPSGHILYEGPENADVDHCPECQEPRYIEGSSSIPRKVLRYFPIISRLRRLYRCPEVAKLMKWHASNKSEDGMMRSVIDSAQWAAVQEIDSTFRTEERNVYMGMVADGVNPFGNQSTKYSMWPVLLVFFNLPPWLLTRKFFISLVLLIPGDKAPNAESFDVFLAPVIRDLQSLWRGVPAADNSQPVGERSFTMRGILLCVINDFPAYGLMSSQQTKGYKGCPSCMTETEAAYSAALKKMVYLGSRRWLPAEHRF